MPVQPLEIGANAPEFNLPQVGPQKDMPPVPLPGGASGPISGPASGPASGLMVLFFYPKDNTPGCTTEAQDFSALLPKFEALRVTVFGISKDSVKRHENFIAKHGLTVPLLSDAETEVCEAYGTWGEKMNYGRTYMGITRTTFLIDANGVIARVWTKVKVKGHAQEVLEAATALVQGK